MIPMYMADSLKYTVIVDKEVAFHRYNLLYRHFIYRKREVKYPPAVKLRLNGSHTTSLTYICFNIRFLLSQIPVYLFV